jgi:hypothetical protein
MSRLASVVSVALASCLSLLSSAVLACTADTECRGQRICVDGKCQESQPAAPAMTPAPFPAATPAPVVAPPPVVAAPPAPMPPPPAAPGAQLIAAAEAPVPAQPRVVAKPADDEGSLLDSATAVWSVSVLAGIDNVGTPGGSQTVFDPHLHLEVGAGVPTDLTKVFAVAYFDGGLPTNGSTTLGVDVFGAGLGLGERYRLTVGGGLALVNAWTGSNQTPYVGGNFTAHASAALPKHIGVHAQFNYTTANINGTQLNFIVGGLGLGYTQ